MPIKLDIQENLPLAPLTTLKIGGPARFFVRAETEEEVIAAFDYAVRRGLPLFVLGGGSNILVADRGFDGLVIQTSLRGLTILERNKNRVLISVRAGEDWDQFVEYAVSRDLAGIECLSGIPGLVGGTPIQNVGAYGQEVSETIRSVRVFDRKKRDIRVLENAECGFSYRQSIFNTTQRERFIVLGVEYQLIPGGRPQIVYKDLIEHFGENHPTLPEIREAVLRIRRDKAMVIDERDINTRSAGSFFKNPVVSRRQYEKLTKIARNKNIIGPEEEIPFFQTDHQRIKVPAAWLIEKSGFPKGYTHGRVGLSSRHTLALINRGGAGSDDLLDLKKLIQKTVGENFGISLRPEPVFIGFE